MSITPTLFDTLTLAFKGIDPTSSDAANLLTKFNAYLTSYATSQGIDISTLSDAEKNALYVQFLTSGITSGYVSEASNALSLNEIAARQTIFAVYSLCIQMLQALQGSMKTQSSLLDLYTQWQSKYTDMTAQLPLYGPQAQNQIVVNDTDFGKTTLGYASLSVQQVFQSLINDSVITSSIIASASWSPPEIGDPFCATANSPLKLTIIKGQASVTGGTVDTYTAEVDIADNWGVTGLGGQTLFSTSAIPINTNLSGQAQQNDVITQLMQQLTSQWKNFVTGPNSTTPFVLISPQVGTPPKTVTISLMPADFAYLWSANHTDSGGTSHASYDQYYLNGSTKSVKDPSTDVSFWQYMLTTGVWGPESMAWPETLGAYDDPNNPNPPADSNALATLRNQEYQYRSQVNAQLQLFLTTAKSKADIVSSYSQQTQTVVSQIQQSIQAQADLLKSIVDTLTTLVSAMFH